MNVESNELNLLCPSCNIMIDVHKDRFSSAFRQAYHNKCFMSKYMNVDSE